jgi:NAD(P)-dependent dehydrogenase (short-subunit alcohol dehydrogenase family)
VSRIDELFGLSGKVAVVTGASSGLGIEFARCLAAAGAHVALLARREDRLANLAEAIEKEFGVDALPVPVDISDRDACKAAFQTIESRLGCIDILVNNAGISPTGRAEKQWPEDWDQTLELNLSALFQCSLLASASMERGERAGRIINIASIFGHLGSSLFRVSSYAASKGGVENLTRQLAVEWAPRGITVNAIAPAWFPSEMTGASLDKGDISDRMGKGSPLGRMGRPGELETACLFLASPASSYVTGTVVPVDGGYSIW